MKMMKYFILIFLLIFKLTHLWAGTYVVGESALQDLGFGSIAIDNSTEVVMNLDYQSQMTTTSGTATPDNTATVGVYNIIYTEDPLTSSPPETKNLTIGAIVLTGLTHSETISFAPYYTTTGNGDQSLEPLTPPLTPTETDSTCDTSENDFEEAAEEGTWYCSLWIWGNLTIPSGRTTDTYSGTFTITINE